MEILGIVWGDDDGGPAAADIAAASHCHTVALDALVCVASAAGQPPIVLARGASAWNGNDMFNGQGLTSDGDRRATIATADTSLPFQSNEPLRGQVSHQCCVSKSAKVGTRSPRHLRSTAA